MATWQSVASQSLGRQAPGVIADLSSIDPGRDWSKEILATAANLNAQYGGGWEDPSRGAGKQITSNIVALAPGIQNQKGLISSLSAAGLEQANAIQKEQSTHGGKGLFSGKSLFSLIATAAVAYFTGGTSLAAGAVGEAAAADIALGGLGGTAGGEALIASGYGASAGVSIFSQLANSAISTISDVFSGAKNAVTGLGEMFQTQEQALGEVTGKAIDTGAAAQGAGTAESATKTLADSTAATGVAPTPAAAVTPPPAAVATTTADAAKNAAGGAKTIWDSLTDEKNRGLLTAAGSIGGGLIQAAGGFLAGNAQAEAMKYKAGKDIEIANINSPEAQARAKARAAAAGGGWGQGGPVGVSNTAAVGGLKDPFGRPIYGDNGLILGQMTRA